MSAPIPNGLRVLLVEDEAIIAMTAEDMLVDLGCSVIGIAHTLADALEAIGGAEFDLALLDINLNGERSLPAAERLRSLGRPFVFTTGYGAEGAGGSFADVPLVSKPYLTDDLAAAIASALTTAGG